MLQLGVYTSKAPLSMGPGENRYLYQVTSVWTRIYRLLRGISVLLFDVSGVYYLCSTTASHLLNPVLLWKNE